MHALFYYIDVGSCDETEPNLIELEELLAELTKVTDWFSFGINLEIPEAKLKEIEKKCESVESYKSEMLTVWIQLAHRRRNRGGSGGWCPPMFSDNYIARLN